MLLQEEYFKSFTKKEIPDSAGSAEAIVGLAASGREEVDELVGKALAAGGKLASEYDHGFMYAKSFEDLDGHLWEIFYMDPSAVNPQ